MKRTVLVHLTIEVDVPADSARYEIEGAALGEVVERMAYPTRLGEWTDLVTGIEVAR